MRLLLDTSTLLWLCGEPSRLSERAVAAIDEEGSELLFSDASVWEITLRWGQDGLSMPSPPRHWLERQLGIWRVAGVPVTREEIYRASELPDLHRDPVDRLLVATALNLDAVIVTPEETIRAYPVAWLW